MASEEFSKKSPLGVSRRVDLTSSNDDGSTHTPSSLPASSSSISPNTTSEEDSKTMDDSLLFFMEMVNIMTIAVLITMLAQQSKLFSSFGDDDARGFLLNNCVYRLVL